MNLLPVCFGPRNGRLNFGDDLGYDPDKRTGLRSMHSFDMDDYLTS